MDFLYNAIFLSYYTLHFPLKLSIYYNILIIFDDETQVYIL
jgi:hypothetical protein